MGEINTADINIILTACCGALETVLRAPLLSNGTSDRTPVTAIPSVLSCRHRSNLILLPAVIMERFVCEMFLFTVISLFSFDPFRFPCVRRTDNTIITLMHSTFLVLELTFFHSGFHVGMAAVLEPIFAFGSTPALIYIFYRAVPENKQPALCHVF